MFSLLTAAGELLEQPQWIFHPVLLRRHVCCWGSSFFLQTPLEYIPLNAYVLIEFFNRAPSPITTPLLNSSAARSHSSKDSSAARNLFPEVDLEASFSPFNSMHSRFEQRSNFDLDGSRDKERDKESYKWEIGSCRFPLDMLSTQFDLQLVVPRPSPKDQQVYPAKGGGESTLSLDISVFLR